MITLTLPVSISGVVLRMACCRNKSTPVGRQLRQSPWSKRRDKGRSCDAGSDQNGCRTRIPETNVKRVSLLLNTQNLGNNLKDNPNITR